MTQQSARFTGSIPDYYDRHLGPRIFHDFADDLVARVAAHSPESVLELAAGTGIVTRRLRDALPASCLLVATDLNSPMLDVARAKFDAGDKTSFEVTDATNLHYEANTFEQVVCQFGVMFFPDKVQSFKEVLRVLKPGGKYIFNVWGPWRANSFAQIAHETVSEFFPDDPPGFYRVPFAYHEAEVIEAHLYAAGFGEVNIKSLDVVSSIPSADDFATGLVYGNPLFEEVTSRGGDPQEVCCAVASALQEQLGSKLPLQAVIVQASAE